MASPRRLLRHRYTRKPRRLAAPRRLALEPLESRALMAGLTAPTIEHIARDRSAPGYNFHFTGEAQPNATVQIQNAAGAAVGSAMADASGQWQFNLQGAQLINGEFRYRATSVDAIGNVSGPSADALFRPNFVIVNVDDMPPDELQYLTQTVNLLGGSGTTFNNSFTPTALSGPSRASLLTGQYAFRHGVLDQTAPLGGELNFDDSNTLPVWLQKVGYKTAWFGKTGTAYDNRGFDNSLHVPPGWSEYNALVNSPDNEDFSSYYYNVVTNHNGVRQTYDPRDYSTDIFAREASGFIANAEQNDPFFVYFAPFSGHGPFLSAARHAHDLADLQFERGPNFNRVEDDLAAPGRRPIDESKLAAYDEAHRNQIRSLLSVDDAVAQLYRTIAERGDLDNTVFVFTSDNGNMWGEHAIVDTKNNSYEEAIRVPMVIRDGRHAVAQSSNEMVLNLDIPATFADMAGVRSGQPMDGVSLRATLQGSTATVRDAFLLEHDFAPAYGWNQWGYGPSSVGIRTQEWKYIEYASGHQQLFNLQSDPFELHNLAGELGYGGVIQQLSQRLDSLRSPDRTGPEVQDLDVQWTVDPWGLPTLQVTGAEDDTATGGSDVKSGEYYIDEIGPANSGKFLDAVDHVFNSSSERFTADIPFRTISNLSPGKHTLFVHARDSVGNWGAMERIEFWVSPRLGLAAGSDTGVEGDGLTVDATPTFEGVAGPGQTIKLYAVGRTTASFLGETTAGDSGEWSFMARMQPGDYKILAVAYGVHGKVLGVAGPIKYHLVGATDENNVLQVRGTNEADQIIVDARVPGFVSLGYNGAFVGTLARPDSVRVEAFEGDDDVTVLGDLPAELLGGDGNDRLTGGSVGDLLDGGLGRNWLAGGPGNDTYHLGQLPTRDKIYVERIVDTIHELPGEGSDTLDLTDALPWGRPVDLNTAGPVLARLNTLGRGILRSVELDGGSASDLETILGAASGSGDGPPVPHSPPPQPPLSKPPVHRPPVGQPPVVTPPPVSTPPVVLPPPLNLGSSSSGHVVTPPPPSPVTHVPRPHRPILVPPPSIPQDRNLGNSHVVISFTDPVVLDELLTLDADTGIDIVADNLLIKNIPVAKLSSGGPGAAIVLQLLDGATFDTVQQLIDAVRLKNPTAGQRDLMIELYDDTGEWTASWTGVVDAA